PNSRSSRTEISGASPQAICERTSEKMPNPRQDTTQDRFISTNGMRDDLRYANGAFCKPARLSHSGNPCARNYGEARRLYRLLYRNWPISLRPLLPLLSNPKCVRRCLGRTSNIPCLTLLRTQRFL